ncbi:MAG: hypothetical protein E7607_01320 [Ruminococcaceae bacterium]|nr:hypothetical protein [Oscillospiraceae bacterium]
MKMDEIKKRKTPRLQGFDYNNNGAYFITICTQNRQCLLSHVVGTGVLDCPKIELTAYGEIAKKYIDQLNDFYDHISVDSYVIMPNHIHILLFVKEDGQSRTPVPTRANSVFSKFISTFKRFCNKEYGKNIWQARSYDHIIRNRQDYEDHLRYIQDNPMRWQFDKLYPEQ